MRGGTTQPVAARPLRGLRILVPTNVVMDNADDAVVVNFERALAELERAGATVARERFDCLDRIVETGERHGTLVAAEAYHEYHAIVDGPEAGRMDRRVLRRILGGRRMSAHDLLTIQDTRREIMAEMENRLKGALLAMPTTPIVAPDIAPLEADDELFMAVNALALRNVALGNIMNLCGLALPSGRDGNGLPTSVLFSAPGGEDDFLLAHGLEIEQVMKSYM